MIIREEYFTMTDGVRLYTRIVLPDGDNKFPIIFMRNPYEEKRGGEPFPAENYKDDLFIKNGYAIIVQHTRGRGDSEGICVPYREEQDGLDTLEIIRTLPFYNGEIYLYGGSYLATVHLSYLGKNPPDVKAAALNIQTDRMYFRNYRNGCCYNFCGVDWWVSMMKYRYPEVKCTKSEVHRPYYTIIEQMLGVDVPEYTNQLLNCEYNDFWKNNSRTYVCENLKIPVLFTEGWYDFYIDGMFSMWDRIPEETKSKSAFVVGPWGHATSVVDTAEYPLKNGNIPNDYIVNFFNSVRDNKEYKNFELGKLTYYSISGDFWKTGCESSEGMRLYFNSDNTLSSSPDTKGELSFEYNPEKVLEYYKYNTIFKAPKAGEFDEVLSFVSSPSDKTIDFLGKITWNMKVKTNCDDTAFFMRVYFVEDGVAYNLTETITSLSYIDANYTADSECMISIKTPPIGFTLKKGNRIRVDISSHSDRYVPHSNTKGHWAKVTETKIAQNTVICDESAYIVLPIK